MTSKTKKKYENNSSRPNGWGMIQNIFIAAMRNGQIVPAIIFLLLLIMILKLNSTQIMGLFNSIGDTFKSIYVLGWVLFGISLLYFERRMKKLRQSHSKEMDRVSEEKKQLQEILTKLKLPTSK